MFSHIMIGSNDVDRSKKFYDALFAARGRNPALWTPEVVWLTRTMAAVS